MTDEDLVAQKVSHHLSVRVPAWLWLRLVDVARREGLSVSELVRVSLEEVARG